MGLADQLFLTKKKIILSRGGDTLWPRSTLHLVEQLYPIEEHLHREGVL